ncbi:family 43 glycosylhydrolase [Bacillus sp. SL00103]
MKITNPVLRGFNPDPSICRVGEDYYMAVSTFEWFPGGANLSFEGSRPLAACARPFAKNVATGHERGS